MSLHARLCVLLGALALVACSRPATSSPAEGATRSPPPATPRPSEEQCLDAWLSARGLNAYGDPPDTVYAGGNPAFNESTGESVPRPEWVYRRRPGAREACGAPGDGGPP
jgi:hypothetical protein